MENTPSVAISARVFAPRCAANSASACADIGVAVEVDRRAAQLGAGMDAGVRQFVDQDQIVRPDQRRDDAGIGEIAGAEHAGRLGALEPRQPLFQFGIERMIAGDEPRGAGADAVALGRLDRRRDDGGMLAEIEIVVAGERQQAAAVALGPNSRARRDRRRAAQLRRSSAASFSPANSSSERIASPHDPSNRT